MTDPMELVRRLEKAAREGAHHPVFASLPAEAAACIREMVDKIASMDREIDLLESELCSAYTDYD